MFSQKEKTKLERKHAVHFPRRTLNNEKRKPNNNQLKQTTQSNTFNESKNKSKRKSFSM
jgi:hypothetical protein